MRLAVVRRFLQQTGQRVDMGADLPSMLWCQDAFSEQFVDRRGRRALTQF